MNIEIHKPRLEALIQQHMASGRFESIEDALVQALEAAPLPPESKQEQPGRTGAALVDAFAKIRGLLTDEEIDAMFRRNLSAPALAPVEPGFGKRLVEAFAPGRGLLSDEAIDTIFRREPAVDRPLDL